MTCMVVEDHLPSLKMLEYLIQKTEGLTFSKGFSDPLDALQYSEQHEPEILFLDVGLPEFNGFEFLKRLQHKPATILTTGYDRFALEAFQFDVIDYLVKPFTYASFTKAVNKAKVYVRGSQESSLQNNCVLIRSNNKFYRINYDDILFIEGLKDYVVITTQTQKLTVAMNLATIFKQLPSSSFVRVHKSFIINFNNVLYFNQDTITLPNASIPIGKSYRDELLRRFPSTAIIRR